MQNNLEKIKQLQAEIYHVFGETSYPKNEVLIEHLCDECVGLHQDFAEKKWNEVNEEIIEKNYDNLPLFSPEAFHYFLPAYLLYTLENFESDVAEFTLYSIAPDKHWKDKNGEVNDYHKRRFEPFDDAQMNVIHKMLLLYQENPDYYNEFKLIERAFGRLKKIREASK